MTIEQIIEAIDGVINAKTIEIRDQKLDLVLNGIPLDKRKIDEILIDIETLRLEAHNLDSVISVNIIQEIIEKYRLH
jgi:hypothetical protein